jgi:hypothetical protein
VRVRVCVYEVSRDAIEENTRRANTRPTIEAIEIL